MKWFSEPTAHRATRSRQSHGAGQGWTLRTSRYVIFLIGALACAEDEVLPPPDPSTSCSNYPDQATSPYVLPYPVGKTYTVLQANCTRGGHQGKARYSYDFTMPIGTGVTAARAGTVRLVIEEFADGNATLFEANLVRIDHGDGTFADYVHLTMNGALVEDGDTVQQGDSIALSGNTGLSSGPHLHFSVNLFNDCVAGEGCETLPVTFSNTRPHPAGLVEGERYLAGTGD